MIFQRRDDDGFGSGSLLGALLYPFRSLGRAMGELLQGDDRIGSDQTMVARLIGLLTLPFRLLFGFAVFMVQAWSSSRPGLLSLPVLGAVPAVMVAGLFFVALLFADLFQSEANSIATNYGYMKFQQETSPEYPMYSHIFAEKLLEMKPDDPNIKYELGLSFERLGEIGKSHDVMASIAPFTMESSPSAHVWLAQFNLRSQSIDISKAEREEKARRHLEMATDIDPENQAAHMNLASIYIEKAKRLGNNSSDYKENIEQAMQHLTTVANGEVTGYQLRATPILAEMQIENGQQKLAYDRLKQEINRLRPIAQRRPEFYQLWLTLVRCAVLAKDYPQALEIVIEGMQLTTNNNEKRQIRQLASMVYLKQAGEFTDMSNRAHYQLRLETLCEAVKHNPADKIVYLKLLEYIGSKKPVPQAVPESEIQRIIANAIGDRLDFSGVGEHWLSDSIVVRGNRKNRNDEDRPAGNPGAIHALLGMRDVSMGNVSDGEKHWRIAEKQFANTQVVINNLIDVAAKERADEFSNMQDMISLAIELFPDQPIFYQTRGVYLKQQGRFNEAVTDLLYASEKMPGMIALHKHLADCYEALGDEQKVLEQQILQQEKLSQLNEADRLEVENSLKHLK